MNAKLLPFSVLSALCGAAAAESLRLEISTDAPCIVLVDEKPQEGGPLAPGTTRTLEMPAGEHLVGCLSVEHPAAMATSTRIGAGTQSVDFVVAATWARFAGDGSGWVTDHQTGLRWHAEGSAEPLDWAAAGAWCASLGGRLPTRSEVKEFHVHGLDRAFCGDGLYCGISHHIRLASRFIWTSDEFEGDQAIITGLAGQKPSAQSVPKTENTGVRALCVATLPAEAAGG